MKPKIFYILILALLSGCRGEEPKGISSNDTERNRIEKQSRSAKVSGRILNAPGKSLKVELYDQDNYERVNQLVKEIPIADDGSFSITISDPNDQIYRISDDEESALVYLRSGFDVEMTVDRKDFANTLAYKGKGSASNNFLALRSLLITKYNPAYSLDEAEYVRTMNDFRDRLTELLAKATEADERFVHSQELDIKYRRLWALYTYQGFHRAFTKDPTFEVSESFPLSEKYPEKIKSVDYQNYDHFAHSSMFRTIASLPYIEEAKRISEKNKSPYATTLLKIINNNPPSDAFAHQYLLDGISTLFDVREPEMTKELFQGILNNSKDNAFISRIQNRFDEVMKLAPGRPSPKFIDYENFKGGVTSLDDFNGKYVYIDLWATWCGPCIAEFPFLHKLEEKLHGNNIVFVSISVDDQADRDEWKKKVETEGFSGVQLLADRGSASQFYSDYGIKSIPRFILVDPDGKIVSSNAPRPSDPELATLLEEHGIK